MFCRIESKVVVLVKCRRFPRKPFETSFASAKFCLCGHGDLQSETCIHADKITSYVTHLGIWPYVYGRAEISTEGMPAWSWWEQGSETDISQTGSQSHRHAAAPKHFCCGLRGGSARRRLQAELKLESFSLNLDGSGRPPSRSFGAPPPTLQAYSMRLEFKLFIACRCWAYTRRVRR